MQLKDELLTVCSTSCAPRLRLAWLLIRTSRRPVI